MIVAQALFVQSLELGGVFRRLWHIQFISLEFEQFFLVVVHLPASSFFIHGFHRHPKRFG